MGVQRSGTWLGHGTTTTTSTQTFQMKLEIAIGHPCLPAGLVCREHMRMAMPPNMEATMWVCAAAGLRHKTTNS